MSQIDLKFVTIRLKDGYDGTGAGTGAVKNVAGYTAGASTMTVDGFTGVLAVGDGFKIAGDDTIYTVSAHTETTGATTSITFTPPLVEDAADDAVITIQPHMLDINIGEGTLSYDEHKKRQYQLNRGRLDTVRDGDEEPMDIRFDIVWEFLSSPTGGAIPTPEEFLKRKGPAANFVSSSDDPCEPYAVDLELLYKPNCPAVPGEDIILEDFRYESLAHDAKAGTLACTGKCNRTEALLSRFAQT